MVDEDQKSMFAQWLAEQGSAVMKVARAYTLSSEDSQDLAQEILLQAWRSLKRFEGRASAATWFNRVALHTAMNWHRKDKPRWARQQPLLEVQATVIDEADSAGLVQQRETVEHLYEAIHQLPKTNAALVLLYLDELSYREMATLAAVLVEAGKLDWTTTIGDVWPQATDADLHPKLRAVTLDQLLSHQSGLPGNISEISNRTWADFFNEKLSPPLERRRMLKWVLPYEPMQPQGEFALSNLGYAIASAMLETRAGESFESLMMRHVFIPLGMRSANFRSMKSAERLQPPLLWGHLASSVPVDPRTVGAENPTVYAGAGTVHVFIEDFARYARWYLVGKPSPVLRTQETFDHLHEPRVDYVNDGKYACGGICLETGLGAALTHSGSNTNSFALIWVLPESDFAAVVCTNTAQPQAFPACDEMMRHLMTKFAELQRDPATVTPQR